MSGQTQITADSGAERALEQAMAVTPSPDFVARVRQRLREEPARSTSHRWPAVAFAGAVVTAIILAVAYWSGGQGPEPAAVANRTATPAPATALVKERRGEPARAPSSISERPTSRSDLARAAPPPLTVRRAPTHEEPREVLISDDERRTLDRFLIAMREGRAVAPSPRRVLEDEDGLLLEPRPIEIPPMRPLEPLPGTAADPSRSRDRW